MQPGGYTEGKLYYHIGRYTVNYTAKVTMKGKSGATYTLTRLEEMKGLTAGAVTYVFDSWHPPPTFEEVPRRSGGIAGLSSATTLSPAEVKFLKQSGILLPKKEVLAIGDLPPDTQHAVAPEAPAELPKA